MPPPPAEPWQWAPTEPVALKRGLRTEPGNWWRALTGAAPPGATGARVNKNGGWKGRRTWGIVSAAVVVVCAVAGSAAAYSLRGSATPVSDQAPVPSATRQAIPAVLGRSASPTPSRSASKAASRPGGSPHVSVSSAPAPASPAGTVAASPPPAVATSASPAPTVTVTETAAPAPFSAAPAPSSAAPTVTVTETTAPATPCGAFPAAGTSIWRCTGTSWQPISCSVAESNGTNGPYNVLSASNECGDRVWLHEDAYPQDEKSGWAYCISPGATVATVPAQYQHPLNIQVSANPAACLWNTGCAVTGSAPSWIRLALRRPF